MGKKSTNENDRARKMVAQEAARIIVNQGIRDYRAAKMKAAERLGLSTRGSLPRNSEIECAIEEHHKLFGGDSHVNFLRSMRESALAAMELLSLFTPRLVGPVLSGTADENSAVNLHVFADDAEAVALQLNSMDIPYRPYERRLKSRRDHSDTFAGFEFRHAMAAIQATVFPIDGIRQAPLSPIDGRPMERADMTRVKGLIEV
ncbi:MAG: hypothetical protein OER97_08240 [Gammaproteobacteria bacterium]|nr:hypothetical protein [Gammaproteobacteria bacterium]